MNIKNQLLIARSRKNWIKVVDYVGANEERFAELMKLFFQVEKGLQIYACQSVGIVVEKQPQLIVPYLEEIIQHLKVTPIVAVKRNAMRFFQFIEIPEDIEGELFDISLSFLKSREEAIAIKVFSITTLRKICEKYPELASEVIFQLEIILKESESMGMRSRANLELKKLQKINNRIA